MQDSTTDLKPKIFTYVMAILFVCTTLTIAAQKKSAVPASPSVFAQDKGKFTIQLNGKSVGHEEFDLAPAGGGWLARSTTDITAPDSPAERITGALTLQPDGAPISYEWTAQAEKTNGAHILFANGVAKITLQMQDARPFEQDMAYGKAVVGAAVIDKDDLVPACDLKLLQRADQFADALGAPVDRDDDRQREIWRSRFGGEWRGIRHRRAPRPPLWPRRR